MKPTLGAQLIDELGRRGLKGAYFDYASYQSLRDFNAVAEVQALLERAGFADVLARDDPAWIADGLEESLAYRKEPWLWVEWFPHIGVFLIPFALLEMARRWLNVRWGSPRKRFPQNVRRG